MLMFNNKEFCILHAFLLVQNAFSSLVKGCRTVVKLNQSILKALIRWVAVNC